MAYCSYSAVADGAGCNPNATAAASAAPEMTFAELMACSSLCPRCKYTASGRNLSREWHSSVREYHSTIDSRNEIGVVDPRWPRHRLPVRLSSCDLLRTGEFGSPSW